MLQQQADKLTESLRELFRNPSTKSELLLALEARLKNFQHLKGTTFQHEVNEFIVVRAEQDCEIILHDEDLSQIWGE